MQRLKVLLVAVINLFTRLFFYLVNKLKRIAIHVLKHPLGTIWWCVKMYFALMLCALFVACSFGAFAQITNETYDPNDSKPAILKQAVCAVAPAPNGSGTKQYGCGRDQAEAVNKAAPAFGEDLQALCGTVAGRTNCSVTVASILPANLPSYAEYNLSYSYKCQMDTDAELEDCSSNNPKYRSQNFSIVQQPKSYTCPPTDPMYSEAMNAILEKYKIGPIKVDGVELCFQPKPNTCFEEADFQIANQYHFDPSSQGVPMVCVPNDKGEKCPWKALPGSNGVFAPDKDNKNACEETPPPPDSEPADEPEAPEKCLPGGNGMMVCEADPNEKCVVNSTGAMSCPDSCGYMNGEFKCFTEPDIPTDPNDPTPEPRPDPDDNVTDPMKPIMDMVKGDFKNIQRGVESRIDGMAADVRNMAAQSKADGDKLAKAAGIGNKLLNSINQNTADTVKELKKLTGDESNPQPVYDETELGEKNDWQVRNFGTVMQAAAEKILEKPMFKAVEKYFDVSFGGSCPTWSVAVWVFEIEIDQFCSQSFQSILPLIRNLVILIFSILAFRVAFL